MAKDSAVEKALKMIKDKDVKFVGTFASRIRAARCSISPWIFPRWVQMPGKKA